MVKQTTPAIDDSEFSTSRSDYKHSTIVRRRVDGVVKSGRYVKGSFVPTHDKRSPRSKQIKVTVGGYSEQLLTGALDGRTAVGKHYERMRKALFAHLGGDLSVPQERLVEQAVRTMLLNDVVWAQLQRNGVFTAKGELSSGFDAFLRSSREYRSLVEVLGIERKTKEIGLGEYIEAKAAGRTPEPTPKARTKR